MADLAEDHPVEHFQVTVDDTTKDLVSAVSNKSIVVLSMCISGAGGATYQIQSKGSGTAVELSGAGIVLDADAQTTVVLPHNPRGWFRTVVSEKLQVTRSAAVNAAIFGTYTTVPL